METELNYLEWDDSLLVGVKQIDDRHKYLFGLLHEASKVSIYYKQADKVNQTTNELIDHVIYHFTVEEQSMKEHQYPGLPLHEQQHLHFVKMLLLELEVFSLNKIPTIESLEHFAHLLRNHIMTVDKQYAEHLRTVGNHCPNNGCRDSGVTGDLYL